MPFSLQPLGKRRVNRQKIVIPFIRSCACPTEKFLFTDIHSTHQGTRVYNPTSIVIRDGQDTEVTELLDENHAAQ